jgi:hypothetical protein
VLLPFIPNQPVREPHSPPLLRVTAAAPSPPPAPSAAAVEPTAAAAPAAAATTPAPAAAAAPFCIFCTWSRCRLPRCPPLPPAAPPLLRPGEGGSSGLLDPPGSGVSSSG